MTTVDDDWLDGVVLYGSYDDIALYASYVLTLYASYALSLYASYVLTRSLFDVFLKDSYLLTYLSEFLRFMLMSLLFYDNYENRYKVDGIIVS